MKTAVVACLCLTASPGALAQACNLDPLVRPQPVAAYVEAARPCLVQPPGNFAFDAALEAAFLARTNSARAMHGLAPLTLRTELTPAARFHSLDMAANGYFDHRAPDGRAPADRMAAFDRTALVRRNAENVATISVSHGRINLDEAVNRLHANLMDSPGHRENILHPEATHAGFGVVHTRGAVWVTQLFVTLEATLPEPAPLRLTGATRLRAPEGLKDWTFVRFDARFANGKAMPVIAPDLPEGEATLTAFATQPGERPGARYSIGFSGPAVTVER